MRLILSTKKRYVKLIFVLLNNSMNTTISGRVVLITWQQVALARHECEAAGITVGAVHSIWTWQKQWTAIIGSVVDFPIARFHTLWTMIKRWVQYASLEEFNQSENEPRSIAATSDQSLGMQMKRAWIVSRFKLVWPSHTDRDVSETAWGFELHPLRDWTLLHIKGYQDIDRYSTIEFEKPVRGMQVGMMPASLAQSLVRLAMWSADKWTVYDPFCGFWTTNYVANSTWFDSIWSDLNPTPAKQNLQRWNNQSHATEKRITFFKHDVTQQFTTPFLKHVTWIATEWRLWPALKAWFVRQATRQQQSDIQMTITKLYTDWIRNHTQSVMNTVPIICAFPQRTFIDEDMSQQRQRNCEGLWVSVTKLDIYQKKGQRVARRVFKVIWSDE